MKSVFTLSLVSAIAWQWPGAINPSEESRASWNKAFIAGKADALDDISACIGAWKGATDYKNIVIVCNSVVWDQVFLLRNPGEPLPQIPPKLKDMEEWEQEE